MSNSNLELSAKHVTKFRLDEINNIKEDFNAEIKERKDIIKKISKYIVAFDYADKLFITLSASFGTLRIASYATVVGIPAGIAGASLTLIFTVTTGVAKTFLNITRKKKKKHNKIITLARSKLNMIENSGSVVKLILENEQLANELHKPIIRKFEKKVYSTFKDNIWGVDLADMQLLSKYNKGIRFLLCVIDIFSKYAWVVPLKDKKGISIVKAFEIILKQSNSRKPNKIWVDKGSEFYNMYFKKWLRDSDIAMYSTHNKGKSVVVERFIRMLKGKIYKYDFNIKKCVY